MNRATLDCPLGRLLISEKGEKICGVTFYDGESVDLGESRLLTEAKKQLGEYFAGKRREFDLPLSEEGSDFALAVRREMLTIPYGETKTYSDIAAAIGKPGAARAVGVACHNNPIAIIVPCHRVIGVNANLVGYAGGVKKKEYLLWLEGVVL